MSLEETLSLVACGGAIVACLIGIYYCRRTIQLCDKGRRTIQELKEYFEETRRRTPSEYSRETR